MSTKVLSVPSHRCPWAAVCGLQFLTLPKNSISHLQRAAKLRIMFSYENVRSKKLCSKSRDTISISELERDQWTTERAPHELLSLEAERIGGTEDREKEVQRGNEFTAVREYHWLINLEQFVENGRLPCAFVAVSGTSVTSNRRYVLIDSS